MELEGSFPEFRRNMNNYADPNQAEICDSPTWLSTSELEDELQAAICQAMIDGEMDLALEEIDVYFAHDDEETLIAYRRSLLRLLGLLRPQLADLLGWASTK
jgi:hypothetical protein